MKLAHLIYIFSLLSHELAFGVIENDPSNDSSMIPNQGMNAAYKKTKRNDKTTFWDIDVTTFRVITDTNLYYSLTRFYYPVEPSVSIFCIWKFDVQKMRFTPFIVFPELVGNTYSIKEQDKFTILEDDTGKILYKFDFSSYTEPAKNLDLIAKSPDPLELVQEAIKDGSLCCQLDLYFGDPKKDQQLYAKLDKLSANQKAILFDTTDAAKENSHKTALPRQVKLPDGTVIKRHVSGWELSNAKVKIKSNRVVDPQVMCIFFDKKNQQFASFRPEELSEMDRAVYALDTRNRNYRIHYIDKKNKIYRLYECDSMK